MITPAFHFKILEKFAEVFDRLGNSFIDKLYELEADKGIEFFHVVARYALDVISGECESFRADCSFIYQFNQQNSIFIISDLFLITRVYMALCTKKRPWE